MFELIPQNVFAVLPVPNDTANLLNGTMVEAGQPPDSRPPSPPR